MKKRDTDTRWLVFSIGAAVGLIIALFSINLYLEVQNSHAPRDYPIQLAGTVGMQSSVTQHGITFTFDTDYEVGQFVNGDWWVMPNTSGGDVTITAITPDVTTASGATVHGFMVNVLENDQAFDSRINGFELALIPTFPLAVSANNSVIKVESVPIVNGDFNSDCGGGTQWNKNCILNAAILTVVDTPYSDVFRPTPTGGSEDKEFFAASDIQTDLIPSLTLDSSNIPSQASIEERIAMPRLDWTGSSVSYGNVMPYNAVRPNGRSWGAELARSNAEVAMWLALDNPFEQKETALYHFLQQGIDIYGARKHIDTKFVHGGGGNGAGRMMPFVFAATLIDDQRLRDEVASTVYNQSAGNDFWESEMFQFTQDGSMVVWGQDQNGDDEDNYWAALVDEMEARTARDPYNFIDGIPTYQVLVALPVKYTAMVFYLYPAMDVIWPEPTTKIIPYADRWVENGRYYQPDPCAPLSQGGGSDGNGFCVLDSDLEYFNSPTDFACTPGAECGRKADDHGNNPDSVGITANRRSDFGDDVWDAFRPLVGTPNCGDGTLQLGETCDDENTNSGDGCSNVCLVESGYHCSGQPSVCQIPPPTVTIQTPADGSTIGLSEVEVMLSTLSWTSGGVGGAHIAITLDNATFAHELYNDGTVLYNGTVAVNATGSSATAMLFNNLDDGQHTLVARLVNESGSLTNPEATDSATFSVDTTCSISTASFENTGFASQSDVFEFTYEATALAPDLDGLLALSEGAQSAFGDYAVLVRFNPSGAIDVRDGAAYNADSILSYSPNDQFSIRIVVDVANQTYDVFVTPLGESEVQLASGYEFRTTVTTLDNWGLWSNDEGTLQVCNVGVSTFITTAGNTTNGTSSGNDGSSPGGTSGNSGSTGNDGSSTGGTTNQTNSSTSGTTNTTDTSNTTNSSSSSESGLLDGILEPFEGEDSGLHIAFLITALVIIILGLVTFFSIRKAMHMKQYRSETMQSVRQTQRRY